MGESTPLAARGEPSEFVRRSWQAHPDQLASLRAEVRRWLTPLPFTDEAKDDLVLAVNEAASNSVEHAYTAPSAGDTVN
jgi:anti-sigma regulatory factor (Ser/Thr protein kinase)